MNKLLLEKEVQNYIDLHLDADTNQIALTKSPFFGVSSAELAIQIISKKKAQKKLPTWYNQAQIYFPLSLSIEQSSSELTAAYKGSLLSGKTLIDLTAGFGVDSFYFAKNFQHVICCEIQTDLCEITEHNAKKLGVKNMDFINEDGLSYLQNHPRKFDVVYADPARRKNSNKVFRLADCTPNMIEELPNILQKTNTILLKTSPLLDIQLGLNELKNVKEIHVVSVKNECKELLWLIEKDFTGLPKIICATLNKHTKTVAFPVTDLSNVAIANNISTNQYLYEPDVALLKSGAFNTIAHHYELEKLDKHSHLYLSDALKSEFIGRIFEVEKVFTINELKKENKLIGNVIVRNFPEKPENLIKKYKIANGDKEFFIFTKYQNKPIALQARIIQYY